MAGLSVDRRGLHALPLTAVTRADWPVQAQKLGARQQRWATASGFVGQAAAFCLLPDAQGATARVVCGIGASTPPFALGGLPYRLPTGDYRLEGGGLTAVDAALGWALGSYRFARYRTTSRQPARLLDAWVQGVNAKSGFGAWCSDVVFEPAQMQDVIAKHA